MGTPPTHRSHQRLGDPPDESAWAGWLYAGVSYNGICSKINHFKIIIK